jgi:hypothetical protein
VTACCLGLVPSPSGRAPHRFIPRLRGPLGAYFSFPADPFCCPGCSSCSGLISGFRASEARPGVAFLTCRSSCCFFFLTGFRFCLSALAQQGFVFPFFHALKPSRSQDNHPVQIFCKPSCCCFAVVTLPLVCLLLLCS